MIGALLGFFLPIAAVGTVLPAFRKRQPEDSRVLMAVAALGIGVGLSSVSTFWLMGDIGLTGTSFVVADALLWIVIAAAGWRHLRGQDHVRATAVSTASATSRLTVRDWAARATFGVIAAIALATVGADYVASPHGQWDAWAIWNQKARFLARAGNEWTASLEILWSQPSHPLLVPASVARLWAYAGEELTAVPALLGLAFGIGIVAAVIGALDAGRARAWIAGSVLVAPGIFPQQVAAQTADLPTGFFVVAALALLGREFRVAWRRPSEPAVSLLLGAALAGFAAWTKNEGLVFLAVATLLITWLTVPRGAAWSLGWWVAGAAPALLAIAWLKLGVTEAPPGYFVPDAGTPTLIERALSVERHGVLAPLVFRYWTQWGGPRAAGILPLTTLAVVVAACSPAGWAARGAAVIIAVMLGAYYLTWASSPLDTVWLISTSFDRVLVQLWPAMVLVVFSIAGRHGSEA